MNNSISRAAAILLMCAVCASVSAQTCRNDILSTAPDSRFTDHGDSTVTDADTGLMWKQCAEGLSGAGCLNGSAATFTWQDALQAAADSDFAGYTDWRLPNKNELESLVERRCYEPAINTTYFPNTPPYVFLSSSLYPSSTYYIRIVDFSEGRVSTDNATRYSRNVRLVRGGQ